MSETWTIDCHYKECKGTGTIADIRIPGYTKPCPPCSGSGGFNLAMEEMCTEETDCDNIDFPNCRITERHYYKSGGYKGIKSCKGFLYRPLTVEEVEDVYVHTQRDGYRPFKRCDKNYLIREINSVLITYIYKGSPVKLQPREVG